MPSVTIARSGISAPDVISALSTQLGSRYKITEKHGKPNTFHAQTSSMSTANIRMVSEAGSTRFHVHGGGIIIGRLLNELMIARKVAAAIRESPQLRAEG